MIIAKCRSYKSKGQSHMRAGPLGEYSHFHCSLGRSGYSKHEGLMSFGEISHVLKREWWSTNGSTIYKGVGVS